MTKPVLDQIILGISDTHDASACLVQGGRILCALAEERPQRVKSAGGFPKRAVETCLKFAGVTADQIDHVAVAGRRAVPVNMLGTVSTFSIDDLLRIQEEKRWPKYYEDRDVSFRSLFPDYHPKSDVHYPLNEIPLKETAEMSQAERDAVAEQRLAMISAFTGVPESRIATVDHHSCHAYYAYYASPFRGKTVAALTMDGGGDGVYDSVNMFDESGTYKRLHASKDAIVGKMYGAVTLILGMRPNEEEYKVMGLAPYAKEYKKAKAREILLDYMSLDGFRFRKNQDVQDFYFYTRDRLKGCRFDGIAGALQDFAEHFLVQWAGAAARELGAGALTFSGGVANNVKANKAIAELDIVERLFVPPGAGDESLSIGACWAAMDRLNKSGDHRDHIAPLDDAYLGPGVEQSDVRAFAEHPNVQGRYRPVDGDANALLAKTVAAGNIVGVCRGRMEFGPRALGHRSIVGNARRPETVEKINDAIKGRDFWMPFAPSVMAECIDDYLIDDQSAELTFMTSALDSTEEGHTELAACLHPKDLTARVQKVSAERSPDYHALISAVRAETGCGAVLNTSLNIHGKPIVMKPVDIANELLSEDWVTIDHFLIEDTFFTADGS